MAFPGLAQGAGSGGMALDLAVETSVDVRSNPQLDVVNPQRVDEISSAFSFGFLTETRSQKLSLGGGISLRGSDGPGGGGVANGVVDPFLALRYLRQVRDASLSFDARMQETDLTQTDPGEFAVMIPTGSAKQRSYSAEINMRWRETAPLGFGVLAGFQKAAFIDGSAFGQGGQALSGTTRHRFDFLARLDLDAAHHLTTTLGYRVFGQEAAAGRRESFQLNSVYQIDRPRVPFAIKLGYITTEAGHQLSGLVARHLALPNGAARAGIGAARATTGGRYVTGHLHYETVFSRGLFEASVNRKLTSSDQDDSEQISTAMGLQYRIDATPLDGFAVGIDWAEAKNTHSGLTTMNRILTVSYTRQMGREVDFNIGLRRRDVRDSVTGARQSNEIFMSLTRKFRTHF
ncbi:hypothetical protein [Sulfitobacter sp. CW3]|uniref:hypothetical protein n=1 Tax=Sulfitobacter sp. CW3 TaxID=2861965 RepID=UPI001C5CFD01|nr:hypothetical protein [Sulfitobacter sp. CW3]MBW4964159.1 hypothetical protein [Sulfitobacter sp. CW3]